MFPDDQQQAVFLADMLQLMTKKGTLQTDVVTSGVYGDQGRTTSVVATQVPYWLAPLKKADLAASGLVGSQESMKDQYHLLCKLGTPLAVDQQFVTQEGLVFNIIELQTELTAKVFESAIVTRQR